MLGASSAFLLACVACSPVPVKYVPGPAVTVTKTQYVALDAKLTAPCAKKTPLTALSTNDDLLNAHLKDDASLDACAAKVDQIRSLQPKN